MIDVGDATDIFRVLVPRGDVAGQAAQRAQISRQYYRGDRWYVLRDPAGNQFHRLSDAAYRFVALLDGSRTVEAAWEQVGGQLADDAPTQPEVIQILSQLYAANLLEADVTPDATVLLRRHKQLQKQQMQTRLMNLLFPRIPLWDVDSFLTRWMPVAEKLLSQWGAMLWLIVVGSALAVVLPRWGGGDGLKAAAAHAIDLHANPLNAIYLYGMFVLLKLLHELGHAFACRRFGGEVHEMGVMFLIFMPTPYVDASTAWAFPSRWQRLFVGAAGMVVELFAASLLAFVWASTTPGSLLNQLAYNGMLIAGVSTVIFNANPLLRYDGYYMLSDLLEIPNLQRKSTEYALGLIKRHVFGIKDQQPLPPIRQRLWLFFYAIASTAYRMFVGVAIILMVTYQLPVIGVLMAMGGVVTWGVTPVVKLVKYLALEPELHRKRGRAVAFSAAVALAAVVLIGLVPFPVHFEAVGIAQPEKRLVLRARTPGFVQQVPARDGQMLQAGQVILQCINPDLQSQLSQMRANLREAEALWNQTLVTDPAQHQINRLRIDALREELAKLEAKTAELTIRAPFAGQLVAPQIEQMEGRYLSAGQEIATVAAMDRLVVRATLDQREAELGASFARRALSLKPDQTDKDTQVRLAGQLGTVLYGQGSPWLVTPQDELPSAAIGSVGGGEVPVDPRDAKGIRPLVEQFEVWVQLPNTPGEYLPGQRAYVRFTLDKKPLFWQWSRWLWQLVQDRSLGSKW